jgi:hypothetical protein
MNPVDEYSERGLYMKKVWLELFFEFFGYMMKKR